MTLAEELCAIPCTVALPVIVSPLAPAAWPDGAVSVSTANCPAVICCGWKAKVTPEGNPETASVANCVKPLLLASDTLTVVVCPGKSVAVPGVALNVKLDAAVIVRLLGEFTIWPLPVMVKSPVAAPVGITKDTFVELKLATEAGIVPVPCWVTMTVGAAPFALKLVPVTETRVPTEADVGVKLVMLGGGITVKLTPLLA